ncbi:MAG: glycosyltransferase family 4 protein [Sphingobacteriales bacterium]|nr:glycosyltransferase family 4 protein [Sphingobacteriales bacterium]
MKLLIIHPGIQHSYRLANAAVASGTFEEVHLQTSVLYPEQEKPWLKSFQKRKKPILPEVRIHRHLIYELLARLSRNVYNKIIINPNKQVHNNPIYVWQFIFGCICLPFLWRHRKNSLLVCFETAGWPLTYFAQKWGIPVVMDFASISHERAESLGIHETNLGKAIKIRERQHIDFAFFCSDFCRRSFEGRTAAKMDFVLYLGADAIVESGKWKVESIESGVGSPKLGVRSPKSEVGSEAAGEEEIREVSEVESLKSEVESREASEKSEVGGLKSEVGSEQSANRESEVQSVESKVRGLDSEVEGKAASEKSEVRGPKSEVGNMDLGLKRRLKISFIANLEYRKGLDILLEALYAYTYPAFLEVHLIGKIRKDWVAEHLPKTIVNDKVKLVYQPAMSQQELFTYLAQQHFDLNVQPSRFDSFAMVVPETMMQGIPNLVSPFVGAGEMLQNGVDGFVMSELDAATLAQSISSFINLSHKELPNLKSEVLKKAAQMTWANYDLAVGEAMREVMAILGV